MLKCHHLFSTTFFNSNKKQQFLQHFPRCLDPPRFAPTPSVRGSVYCVIISGHIVSCDQSALKKSVPSPALRV